MSKIEKYQILSFTEYPGPRYKVQGEDSGEEFYEKVLKTLFEKVLKDSENGEIVTLEVDLDNTAGYASSFLDEAFGNLTYDFGDAVVKRHLQIVSKQEPDWQDVIFNETIPEWQTKKNNGTPRK